MWAAIWRLQLVNTRGTSSCGLLCMVGNKFTDLFWKMEGSSLGAETLVWNFAFNVSNSKPASLLNRMLALCDSYTYLIWYTFSIYSPGKILTAFYRRIVLKPRCLVSRMTRNFSIRALLTTTRTKSTCCLLWTIDDKFNWTYWKGPLSSKGRGTIFEAYEKEF